MNYTSNTPDSALLDQIGQRFAAHRLVHNLTQRQLAEQAGVGLRTVQRLEAGAAATHLSAFLRICRVLGLLDRIDALIPEPAPSPIAQLRLQGKRRKRARRTERPQKSARWAWDDHA